MVFSMVSKTEATPNNISHDFQTGGFIFDRLEFATTPSPDPVHLYEEGQIIVQIRKWIFCPFGCLGSVLCILILLRPPMNRLMMTPYLIIISLNDFFYLLSDTLNEIVFRSGWTADWYCKLARYIADTCGSTSDLLVAVVAVHRAIAVSLPLKAERYCGPRSPLKLIITVTTAVMLIFLEVFWIAEADPQFFCRDAEGTRILVQMEAAIIMGKTVLAVVTIAASSVVILHKLRESRELVTAHCYEEHVRSSRKSKEDQIGTMLLSISVLFLATNLPLAVFFIVRSVVRIEPWLNEFIYVLTLTLKNLNHVLNFLFYCCSAHMFRAETRRLFSCHKCCPPTASYQPHHSSSLPTSPVPPATLPALTPVFRKTSGLGVPSSPMTVTTVEFLAKL